MGFASLWMLSTPFIIILVSLLRSKSGKRVGIEKAFLVGILYLVFGLALSYTLTGSL